MNAGCAESVPAFIGLGSNLGDRRRNLRTAAEALAAIGVLRKVSSLYETAPIGGPEQDPYLNAVAMVETTLSPAEVVERCLAIEHDMGRIRRERWGPRLIDLDLLLYGDRTVDEPGVTVPHPRLAERRFAIEPIVEIEAGATLPGGIRLMDLLETVADQEVVRVTDATSASPAAAVAVFLITGIAGVLIWLAIGHFL